MTNGIPLADLLASVPAGPASPRDGSFRVYPIPGPSKHYVGRNDIGQPCVLLGSDSGPMHPPVRLAAIEARFGAICQIRPVDAEQREETLTTVVCTSSDPQAQIYFLHVCETIIRILGASPSLPKVVEVVQRLIELFRRLTKPASRSVIGLLGELYLIGCSRGIVTTVTAWRSADIDRFDFSIADVRLDVKTSGERVRAHHLSAEQCHPPAGTTGLLVSMFIEGSGGGMSLIELLAHIERRLAGNDALILKVQEIVAETLGDTLPTSMVMRFDDRLAQSSLQIYDLRSIPAIRDGIPAEVSQVHFRSDLSRTPPLSVAQVSEMTTIGRDMLPA
ncbi:PD-(D/E)XK motif protein [Acetobacteraceae bacterium KSS8]|uniref:PD-(D/E)XK motif protein n=1 Tax=Endosaccharibacter trunci TaxID=2812733 RepID=A0ABT1WAR2_9PROT|nr:PD-(D/E)XK motif protein [Acetobacteraceae bacterium KSS8]